MPPLSGLNTVEFDKVRVRKPEGGVRFNLFDVFVRKPEHIGHVTNGVFDAVDDTHIVSTNALTQLLTLQKQQTETVLLVQQPLPSLNIENSDLADIKALLQSLSERVTQLESQLS